MTEIELTANELEDLIAFVKYNSDGSLHSQCVKLSKTQDDYGDPVGVIVYPKKPFAPEQLVELGWVKDSDTGYEAIYSKDKLQISVYGHEAKEMSIYKVREDNAYAYNTDDLFNGSIPSTHAELLTLLKLVCGEGK